MKTIGPLLVLASFALTAGCSAADDASATSDDDLRAKKTLLCASSAKELVYFGEESQVRLEANVSRDGILANAALTMTANDNLGIRNETWNAQKKYAPANPRYKGMQKYTSADAWCGYSVIAPPSLNGQTGKFTVYVQQACEGGFVSTATLSCKVESKKAVTPDAPTAPASLELRFTPARRKAAVDAGAYKASAFTGNAIVVSSAHTELDIDQLVDSDSESAPDTICFTGDPNGAKKILWAMLGNTDGNGDHWLDEGARIKAGANGALAVTYSVTGEGGSQPRALAVPVCP